MDTANGISGLGGKRGTFLLVFYGYLGAGNMLYEQATSEPSGRTERVRFAADGAGQTRGEQEQEGTTIEA